MMRTAQRRYYEANKARVKARAKQWSRHQVNRIRKWLDEYLAGHPCVECGEADPIVLDFHHRDRDQKTFTIKMYRKRVCSLSNLIAEVMKCDVLCSNCHRRRTHSERAWCPRSLPAALNGYDHPELQLRLQP